MRGLQSATRQLDAKTRLMTHEGFIETKQLLFNEQNSVFADINREVNSFHQCTQERNAAECRSGSSQYGVFMQL